MCIAGLWHAVTVSSRSDHVCCAVPGYGMQSQSGGQKEEQGMFLGLASDNYGQNASASQSQVYDDCLL